MIQENSEHFKQEVHKKRVCLDSLKRSHTHLSGQLGLKNLEIAALSQDTTERSSRASVINVRISYSVPNLNSPLKIGPHF